MRFLQLNNRKLYCSSSHHYGVMQVSLKFCFFCSRFLLLTLGKTTVSSILVRAIKYEQELLSRTGTILTKTFFGIFFQVFSSTITNVVFLTIAVSSPLDKPVCPPGVLSEYLSLCVIKLLLGFYIILQGL